ncbi:MAG: YezD family protein [Deltaproteobacteria bacterium]|nr:YezD family protein [Deltaproteobacteria bacterium]
MAAPAPAAARGQALRAENERKAIALVLEAIRQVRYGVVTVVLQDGLVVQVERAEKTRILTRREVEMAGEGEGI